MEEAAVILQKREDAHDGIAHRRYAEQQRETVTVNGRARKRFFLAACQSFQTGRGEVHHRKEIPSGNSRDQGFGNHVGGVVAEGVGEGGRGGNGQTCPDSATRNDVAEIAQGTCQHHAKGHFQICLHFGPAEDTRQPKGSKGDDIVQQDDGDNGLPGGEIGKSVQTQQLLDDAVYKSAGQPEGGAVAVGDDGNGKEGCGGDGAAVGEVCQLDHAEHGGKGDHDRTFGQAQDRFGFHIESSNK